MHCCIVQFSLSSSLSSPNLIFASSSSMWAIIHMILEVSRLSEYSYIEKSNSQLTFISQLYLLLQQYSLPLAHLSTALANRKFIFFFSTSCKIFAVSYRVLSLDISFIAAQWSLSRTGASYDTCRLQIWKYQKLTIFAKKTKIGKNRQKWQGIPISPQPPRSAL